MSNFFIHKKQNVYLFILYVNYFYFAFHVYQGEQLFFNSIFYNWILSEDFFLQAQYRTEVHIKKTTGNWTPKINEWLILLFWLLLKKNIIPWKLLQSFPYCL